MIFLTEQLLNDNKKFLNLIDDEIALNQASLKSQKALKNILLDYMQRLATSTIVDPTNSSKILKVLLSFKNSLELSKTNIINLENLLNLFNDVKAMDNATALAKISEINSTIIDLNDELFKNNSEILQTLKMTLSASIQTNISNANTNPEANTLEIIASLENNSVENIEEKSIEQSNDESSNTSTTEIAQENKTDETNSENTTTENVVVEENSESADKENTKTEVKDETDSVENQPETDNSNTDNSTDEVTPENKINVNESKNDNSTSEETTIEPISIQENTLIISEKTKKVFLPYKFSSLETVFKNNPNEYTSIEDIIRKDFIIPLDLFKIPSVSRFREAFKLMRDKENKSFKESLDLAIELFFNYNLHPAIISACRNLDELDIYLDYLADNETHKFNCFNIIFEVAPALSKHSMRRKKTDF